MKKGFFALFIIIIAIGLFMAGRISSSPALNTKKSESNSNQEQAKIKKILYWVAPMDANYKRDKPGKSPMGMDLVPVYADINNTGDSDDKDLIKISPAVVQNLGVKIYTVQTESLPREIHTVGHVNVNEDHIHVIPVYTPGWVRKLQVKRNEQRVTKNQLLFELYAPLLVNAQEELLLAIENKDQALIAAAKSNLTTFGVTNQQIERIEKNHKTEQTIQLFSPIDGYVAQLNIREGKHVEPGDQVMTIENLDSLWVMGQVFTNQMSWIKVGQKVQVTFPSLSHIQRIGTVDFIYPKLDETTLTAKVRFVFDNTNEIIKPNMFADVVIFVSPKKNVLTIPRSAPIRTSKHDYVLVALGNGKFKRQMVKLGIEAGGKFIVLSGLTSGQKIVTSGQFLIDSESNVETSLARIEIKNPQNIIAPKSEPETKTMHMHHTMDHETMDHGTMDHSKMQHH